MKPYNLVILASIWLTFVAADNFYGERNENTDQGLRKLKGKKGRRRRKRRSSSSSSSSDDDDRIMLNMTVTNLSFQQPFGQFLLVVHNRNADPLFTLGSPASAGLRDIAENGNATALAAAYTANTSNVYMAKAVFPTGVAAGGSASVAVPITARFRYISIASMCLNTNDCFVALNAVRPVGNDVYAGPGYDSGTEQNNELCTSIPGPACAAGSGNVASGGGEGFVHVHRGFFGVGGTLAQADFDWRNPMIRVTFQRT